MTPPHEIPSDSFPGRVCVPFANYLALYQIAVAWRDLVIDARTPTVTPNLYQRETVDEVVEFARKRIERSLNR